MKISEQWLRSWVNPNISLAELSSQLMMAGIEIESIIPAAADFSKVVVGEVIAAEQHPNADKLRVCNVKINSNEESVIVCGAKNARSGIKVAVALPGAVLPNGLNIKTAKLRGVESNGMLCSEAELGLPKTIEGIMELPLDAPVGADLRDYLLLNDNVLEVNLTPNRADCLSLAGIAREVAALNNLAINEPKINHIPATIADIFPVKTTATAACPRYVSRIIKGIKNDAVTPLWMKSCLQKSGLKSISPVVDVTNYVMLELGQPIHAFDLSLLNKEINVRYAADNETITTLDGQQFVLNSKTLVIADAKQPLALAGIMGGLNSGIKSSTKDLFLESAFFSSFAITNTARNFGLHTDSSHRFERGVDPNLPLKAMHRLSSLLLEIVGGQPGPINEIVHEEYLPKKSVIELRHNRIAKILGINPDSQQVEEILTRLGMQVTKKTAASNAEVVWNVIPPSARFDINIEVDLIEEIARIYGYEQIPTTLPEAKLNIENNTGVLPQAHKIQTSLVNAGYHETLTYSFTSAELQCLLDPENQPIALKNPLNNDLAVMRTMLWPGLINTYLHNTKHQQNRIRLFEVGNCFIQHHHELRQQLQVGMLASGEAYPEQWSTEKKPVDFFDIKHDLEQIFAVLKVADDISYRSNTHPALHPGCSAGIHFKDKLIGYIGELHPRLTKSLAITQKIYLANFDVDAIYVAPVPKFKEMSKYPAITRDLALVVDRELPAKDLVSCIQSQYQGLLRLVEIFDIYQGENIAKNKKSIALKLIFQHNDRTLIDEEIEQAISQLLVNLDKQFGAKLRS